jgi:hypothetical protein
LRALSAEAADAEEKAPGAVRSAIFCNRLRHFEEKRRSKRLTILRNRDGAVPFDQTNTKLLECKLDNATPFSVIASLASIVITVSNPTWCASACTLPEGPVKLPINV